MHNVKNHVWYRVRAQVWRRVEASEQVWRAVWNEVDNSVCIQVHDEVRER